MAHLLMVILVICWGFDYVPAKWGLEILTPMGLLFFKYSIGLFALLIAKLVTKNKNLIRLKDLPIFILCSIFGEVLYFYCEYSAMDYLPVSVITIILAFVPIASIVTERILFKIHANKKILIGVFVCVVGVILVLGTDLKTLAGGAAIGYLFVFGAVLFWNAYNFITSRLGQYDSLTLSCTQMICTLCICAPLAIHTMPAASEFTPLIVGGLIWNGLIDTGYGFIAMVYSLKYLGPTTSSIYSNFLPVAATLFSLIFLHESITWLQIAGGIIVITSGVVVIKEKGRLDEQCLKLR